MVEIAEYPNVCFSGGAIGADFWWCKFAEEHGHKVIAYSFEDHKFTGPISWREVLTQEQLELGVPTLKNAAACLGRTGAPGANKYIRNLLLRNFWQIDHAERIYGIGFIGRDGEDWSVDGGTAWAFEMFISRHQRDECEAYFFDLHQKWWYQWQMIGWKAMPRMPPKPHGLYAGVGTRQLGSYSQKAIQTLWDQPAE